MTTITQIVLATPPMSWLRKMSLNTQNSSISHAKNRKNSSRASRKDPLSLNMSPLSLDVAVNGRGVAVPNLSPRASARSRTSYSAVPPRGGATPSDAGGTKAARPSSQLRTPCGFPGRVAQ